MTRTDKKISDLQKLKEQAPLTTPEVMARLQRHYIKPGENLPGGVFLPEVSWNGRQGRRRCDAIYAGFTSTSGQILIGHEVKTSRADLVKELDDNFKADEWAKECHEWWLVLGHPSLASGLGIPSPWGVMAPGRSKIRLDVLKPAYAQPRTHTPSWDAVRSIMARQDTLRAEAITAARRKAQEDASDEVEKLARQRVERALANDETSKESARVANQRFKDLAEALGMQVDWQGHGYGNTATLDEVRKVGAVLRDFKQVQLATQKLTATYDIKQVERIAQNATVLAQLMDKLRSGESNEP